MTRFRPFWILLGLLASGVSAMAATISRGPYLQSAGPDRMTVCWRTDEPTTSEVAVGTDAALMGPPATVPGTRTDHFVTLTGLQASTRYFYRISGSPATATAPVNVGGANYWFETSPPAASKAPTRMWVIGDSGSNLLYAPYVQYYAPSVALYQAYLDATSAAGKATDLWLMLGDNAYNGGTDAEYQISVFDKYPALLRNSAMWSAIGNHELSSIPHPYTGPAPYDAIMSFPSAGECGGVPSGTERYYSFDRGNVHFVCLDSSTPGNFNNTGGAGGMMEWLVKDLKATSAPWIIAYFHHAPYSGGSHISDTQAGMTSMRENYVPVLEAYGVDLVLAGHSHVYERSALISGHYGTSSTWNNTMRLQGGNGSDLGGVGVDGSFSMNAGMAQGIYQKPMATAGSGSVYAVVGSSGSLANWNNISPALINPSPYPAHVVSLRLMGGLVIETNGERLNGRYLDQVAAIRDDFTILKGSTYKMHEAVPTSQDGVVGVAFPVLRTGALAFAEEVPVGTEIISGSGSVAAGIAQFAAGQSSALVKFFPGGGDTSTRFNARLLPTSRSVQPGAAPRAAYRIAGEAQTGQFAATAAGTWYASRFGSTPASAEVWNLDEDADGSSRLLEYAIGGEPGRNDAELLPKGTVEAGSFVFRYTRPSGRSDVTYQVLGSADLSSWSLPALTDVSDGPPTALGEPRKVELPAGSPVRFVRLKVELAK